MFVLGINAFHGDSSAAILKDGVIIAAAEEERFTRKKHWAGIPVDSIGFCLEFAGIKFSDISNVAINTDSRAHITKKFGYMLTFGTGFKLALEKLKFRSKRENILTAIESKFGQIASRAKLHNVEHHLCHLASAYYPSGYESASLLSIDGFGDFSSAAWGIGNSQQISVLGYQHFPHSLGIFYQAITQFLGFKNYGDEYKVMGLASYGQPEFVTRLMNIVESTEEGMYKLSLPYFRHHNKSLIYQWEDGIPRFENLYSKKFEQLLGQARTANEPITQFHKNIAASAQQVYEEILFKLLNNLYSQTKIDRLAMAGGCAMNSVANGKILGNTKFKKVYVQPAAGDAGGAIGAALIAWKDLGNEIEKPVMATPYLGPGYSNQQIETILSDYQDFLRKDGHQVSKVGDRELLEFTAYKLADGAVVGWFQGRMEWGARALGNRSILADPRRSDMQQLLNEKIKRRESFRPFAPSILREHVSNWFDVDDDVPFMEKVYPVKSEMRDLVPAITHIDGTGRLQTVETTSNPRYYKLIEEFHRRTNIPMLLNTSFNENEPIVCTPKQALQCYLRTKMDVLILENFILSRHGY